MQKTTDTLLNPIYLNSDHVKLRNTRMMQKVVDNKQMNKQSKLKMNPNLRANAYHLYNKK